MEMRMLIPCFSLGVAFMLFAGIPRAQGADDQAMPAVGTAAPDFSLENQEGKPVRLRDFQGKWVVLYFYPKDRTPGCTIEAHGFTRDQGQFVEKNAVVLGVSVDSVDSHKVFCAKDGINFMILSDVAHDVAAKYGSLSQGSSEPRAARYSW